MFKPFYFSSDSDFFKLFCKIIKNPIFDYSQERIEKVVNIKNIGDFKFVVEWQDQNQCGIDVLRKTIE